MDQSEIAPSYFETPILDQFPKLRPLTEFNGGEVVIRHKDRSFIVSTIAEDRNEKEVCFGLWEKRGKKKIPVGFLDAFINPTTAIATVDVDLHREFKNMPPDFQKLEDVSRSDRLGSVAACIIHRDYRRTGIADILNAISLATFQALGVKQVHISTDLTIRRDGLTGSIPQFKTENGLIRLQERTSFYSKHSTAHSFEKSDTIFDARLSGFQIALLKQAGL